MGLWIRVHGPDLAQVWGACWLFLVLFWRGMACPTSCSCNSTSIWCTRPVPGIAAFPVLDDYWQAENITDIYIQNQRKFVSINDDDVKIYTGLRSLSVIGCGLNVVSRQAFRKNLKLTNINFSRNKLTTLLRKPFRHLSLSKLIVDGNPFQCSCNLLWVKMFQDTNSMSKDENLYCLNENDKKIALYNFQMPNCDLPVTNVSTTNVTILEGGEVSIYCDATGLPYPNVSWDVSQIISKTLIVTGKRPSVLSLKNVTSLDNKKNITCMAENIVGEDSVIVELNVHFPPMIILMDTPILDHHWCIPFTVRGNPMPKLQWFYEGITLSETKFIWSKIHETSNNMNEHHGCLQLDGPTHLNNGLYTLQVENQYGKDERTVMAHFMKGPDYDYETTPNDFGGTTDIGNGVTSTDVSNEGNEDSITVYVVVGIAALVCTGLVIMLIILKFGRHSKFGLKDEDRV